MDSVVLVLASDGDNCEPVAETVDMRITGKLNLQGKVARRFLDVPTAIGKQESGGTVFASNLTIRASMLENQVNDLSGVWVASVRKDTVKLGAAGSAVCGQGNPACD